MQSPIKDVRMVGAVLVCVAAVAFGQLLICQQCGYENEVGAAVCTHCSGSFPVQAVPEVIAPEESVETQDEYLPLPVVLAEMAEGQQHLQGGNYELARFFFLNALALEALTDPADHGNRSENLLGMVRSAESAARIVRKACPRCGGSGQEQVVFEGLHSVRRGTAMGSERAFAADGQAGVTCRGCDGRGTAYVEGTIADRMFARRAAESAYVQYQQAKRYEPLGGAWVPPQLIETLNVRQQAMIMRSIVLSCRSCRGFGRSDCSRCVGRGSVPCRNCDEGRVSDVSARDRVQRIGADRTRACDVCDGTGGLPCENCEAEGTVGCRSCGGSGDADVCRACEARGYVMCRRCRGTKVHRGEVCPFCNGDGEVLCSSCRGRGRRD